jgi:hypothetical protein
MKRRKSGKRNSKAHKAEEGFAASGRLILMMGEHRPWG